MANSDYSSITEIVPQLSYEIVGRIIPGIIVIFSLVVVTMGPTQFLKYLDETVIHPHTSLSGWAVVLMVLTAYSLAFILDGIWQIPACFHRFRRRNAKPKPCLRYFKKPSNSLKFDIVNLKLPKAGAWLTKLYAETNSMRVLIIGWGVSAAINIYYLVTALSVERLCLEVGLVAGIIGAAAVRNSITTTRKDSLENLWFFLRSR